MSDPVYCAKGCGKEWERDPALEVECPHCHAPIGVECKRPSGHRVWGGDPHPARDILADQLGHYGVCPRGCCGVAKADTRQMEMFDAPRAAC